MSAPAAVRSPFIQNTPAWVDARAGVLGSSDIPIVTGNSPFKTSRPALWGYKTRLAPPEPPDADTQELWDLGHAMEPVIAARYTAITGRPIRRVNQMLLHPTVRWASASLDRLSARKGERRIIELKWAPHRRFDDGPEPVPAHVQDQCQWQLFVTHYDVADVAVLHGSHVEVYEIEPDAEYQDNLLFLARHFMGYVERREMPPIDGSEATRRLLGRMYPHHDLALLTPTAEIDALAAGIRVASTLAKETETEERRLKNVLRAVLGESEGVDGDGYRFRLRQNRSGTKTNWQGVAGAYRQLILGGVQEPPPDMSGPEALDAIESIHTTETEGAHVLTVRYQDEETGKWS